MTAEIDVDTVIKPGFDYMVPQMRHKIAIILTQTPNVQNRAAYESMLETLAALPDSSMVYISINPDTQEMELMGSF